MQVELLVKYKNTTAGWCSSLPAAMVN